MGFFLGTGIAYKYGYSRQCLNNLLKVKKMKFQNLIKASMAALAFGTASHAMADVITLDASNLPANGYLSAGKYSGSFNGTGLLPTTYTVNKLSFDFKFADDSNDPFSDVKGFITSTETLTSTTGNNRTATRTTTYLVPITSTGESESVMLNFGALSFFGKTSAGNTTTTPSAPITEAPVKGTDIWVKGSGATTVQCTQAEIDHDSSCKKVTYYTVKKTVVTTSATDYTGMISFSGDLVSSLFQNNKLDFTLDVTGDLYLTNASLDVDFDVPVPTAAVPEPGSLALFGIAMFAAAGVSRKRRA